MINKLIVGVPIKNDLESLKAMISSFFNSIELRKFDFIVIIGEGTNQETLDYLNYISDIHNKGNFPTGTNFRIENIQSKTSLEAYNYLFDLAKKEKADLFLTQTDVLFPKLYKRDWLEIMKDIAQNETVGAVTCINGGGISGPDYINGFEWLGGWCSYYPYRTIEKIGGYDKNFPRGWGVDIDHTYRLFKEKLDIVKLNYWVDHHMINNRQHDDDEQGKQEASKYFKKKWNI